eukprot:CAMPEP_0174710784 /NCGR_PEP_ID=MMETSP1094-20130205/12296_1 /TAXON_ID=156173 /ORGANISM="Chrysochromulina brevifilum, Strain UTEX LB 985" /LENGTH=291 /DNA_ID=CAMNT_0015909629 /DNA_START=177 /DNA_END=1053 /DNA_ORIENTATION=-
MTRARAANRSPRCLSFATSPDKEKKCELKVAYEDYSDDDSTPRVMTELRMRLRILAERDEAMWGAKEMKAALIAGGEDADSLVGIDDKKELIHRTQAMALGARRRWAEEAAAEAAAANRPLFCEKFRAISRQHPRADLRVESDRSHRSDGSDDTEEGSSSQSSARVSVQPFDAPSQMPSYALPFQLPTSAVPISLALHVYDANTAPLRGASRVLSRGDTRDVGVHVGFRSKGAGEAHAAEAQVPQGGQQQQLHTNGGQYLGCGRAEGHELESDLTSQMQGSRTQPIFTADT